MLTHPFRQEGKRWPHSSQGDTLGESQAALLQSSHFSCGEPSFFNRAHTPASSLTSLLPHVSPCEREFNHLPPRPRASLQVCSQKLKEGCLPKRRGDQEHTAGPGPPHPGGGKTAEQADDSSEAGTSLPLADLWLKPVLNFEQ